MVSQSHIPRIMPHIFAHGNPLSLSLSYDVSHLHSSFMLAAYCIPALPQPPPTSPSPPLSLSLSRSSHSSRDRHASFSESGLKFIELIALLNVDVESLRAFSTISQRSGSQVDALDGRSC